MLIQKGDKGSNVEALQYGVHIMGFNPNGFDGNFGNGTFEAVKKFQTKFKLDVDGIVGNKTWNELCSEISSIQTRLKDKGFNVGATDGIANEATYNAVIAFQKANSLIQNGMVIDDTEEKLFKSEYDDKEQPTLRRGCKGEAVKRLQELLIAKGYNCGSAGADGDFGSGTYNAVIEFQGDHDLVKDGIVGPATWAELMVANTTPEPNPELVKPTEPETHPTPILKLGCKGDDVKRLQELLIAKGYSCGSAGADGDFGSGTYNAVIKFQEDYNLDVDGVVGPNTWANLYSDREITSTPNPTPDYIPGDFAGSCASENLIYFIKGFEGYAPSPYIDPVGVRTAGYGMTGQELQGLPNIISEDTATKLLTKHVNELYYEPVLRILNDKGIKALQREIDAFTSFAYNNGVESFRRSTLLRKYSEGMRGEEIHNEFKRWVHGGGKVLPGLVIRRENEWKMFSGSNVSVPGYNCRPTISYIDTSGRVTGQVVTENNGYGAKPY